MESEPRWELLRTFAAVMRAGSLSGAARSLGLSQPSVSRHIDELERGLATKLFVRTQRGLSPTDRALALVPYAQDLEATAAALLRAASASPDAVAGRVRMTAAQAMAVGHLPPILATLRQAHPRLSIELAASDALEYLLARRADIAVRMVDPMQQALVARRVGAVTLELHATRDYLARCGMPESLRELADHDLIGPDTPPPFVRAVLTKLPLVDPNAFALRSDSDVVHLGRDTGGRRHRRRPDRARAPRPVPAQGPAGRLPARAAAVGGDARGPARQPQVPHRLRCAGRESGKHHRLECALTRSHVRAGGRGIDNTKGLPSTIGWVLHKTQRRSDD